MGRSADRRDAEQAAERLAALLAHGRLLAARDGVGPGDGPRDGPGDGLEAGTAPTSDREDVVPGGQVPGGWVPGGWVPGGYPEVTGSARSRDSARSPDAAPSGYSGSRGPAGGGEPARTRRELARERAADATPVLLRRIAVGPRSVLAALAVLLAVAAGAVLRLSFAQQSAAVVPVSQRAVAGATPQATPGTTGKSRSGPAPVTAVPGVSGVGSSPAGAGEVVVHIVGHVKRPGIVRLATGSRVVDAVSAAGGLTRGADVARVNLARLLVDGEQVYVPAVGEALPSGGGAGSGTRSQAAGASAGPVHLNSADEAALDSLPGVGPVLAQRILTWRAQHGSFSSVDELGEVQGIGNKLLENLRPLVAVP